MTATTTVDGRTVVHRRSAGFSIAFADVCKTPPGKVPIPYVSHAFSKDLQAGAATVRVDGEALAVLSSFMAPTMGDEPGTDGGVISGCNVGKASFITFSFDVIVEGQPTPRQFDMMLHNHGSPGNAVSPAEIQPPLAVDPDMEMICIAFCLCRQMGMREACIGAMMTREWRWSKHPFYGRSLAYEPKLCGYYWQPVYEVPTTGIPPQPYPSGTTSRSCPGPGGAPLELPLSGMPVHESRRPDIVVAQDPTRPPTGDNIRAIYEVKFDGDEWGPGQLPAYQRIAGNGDEHAGKDRVKEISSETCKCGERKLEPFRVVDEQGEEGTEGDALREILDGLGEIPWLIPPWWQGRPKPVPAPIPAGAPVSPIIFLDPEKLLDPWGLNDPKES